MTVQRQPRPGRTTAAETTAANLASRQGDDAKTRLGAIVGAFDAERTQKTTTKCHVIGVFPNRHFPFVDKEAGPRYTNAMFT